LLQTLLEGWTGAMKNLSEESQSPAAEINPPEPAPSEQNPYSPEPAAQAATARSWQL
jgi:hypothetical protein